MAAVGAVLSGIVLLFMIKKMKRPSLREWASVALAFAGIMILIFIP